MKIHFLSPMRYLVGKALLSLALALSLLPLSTRAQNAGPGRISGSLVDAGSGQPVPFSDVLLLRAADSTLVAAAQSNEQGTFAASLPLGAYLLRVQDLNYRPLRRRFTLTAPAPTLRLPGLRMSAAAATRLGEITVTGQKAVVVDDLGKRVINVEKDLSSVGGTAVNVLQNVPSVAVDASGVVSMRGSSNLTILIDGKPAGTANGGTGARLDQLPASQIAQIEIMTNPSAKYDASGAGVINIITKKQQKNGFNGQIGLIAGTGDKYAPTLSLSRRQGKAAWNLSYSGRDQRYHETNDNTQVAHLADGQVVRARQTGAGLDHSTNHRLSLDLDYKLNPENTLSLNVTPALERNNESSQALLTQQPDGGAQSSQYGAQSLAVDVKVLNTSADYRRTWAAHAGRELTANAGWVGIAALAPVTQTLTGGPSAGWRQDLSAGVQVIFVTTDYVHPLANGKGRFETGFKVQGTASTGTADTKLPVDGRPGEFGPDAARSVAYNCREVLPAAYATLQRTLGHGWSAQGGLRTEYTTISGAVKNRGGGFGVEYLSWFPSATVARELGPKPGHQKVQLSYARRLNRPNFMQQLPFAFYQDPLNYRVGDPNLRAEFSHNVELGHELNREGGAAFTTTVFGRFTQDAIQRLRGIDTAATRLNHGAGLVTAETYRNQGRTTSVGAEITWNQPLAAWWRVGANASLYRSEVATTAAVPSRHALASTVRLTNNFQPLKTLDVQLTGSFRSATLTAQGRQLATGGLDVALRQRLFDDRAALTLRVSDVFNTQVRRYEVDTPELQAAFHNKYETRVAWAGFTWYLGASKPAKRIEAAPQGGGAGFGG
ncbi:MAG: outer membrane beta-barrel family protein [Hymenobacter sp.]